MIGGLILGINLVIGGLMILILSFFEILQICNHRIRPPRNLPKIFRTQSPNQTILIITSLLNLLNRKPFSQSFFLLFLLMLVIQHSKVSNSRFRDLVFLRHIRTCVNSSLLADQNSVHGGISLVGASGSNVCVGR